MFRSKKKVLFLVTTIMFLSSIIPLVQAYDAAAIKFSWVEPVCGEDNIGASSNGSNWLSVMSSHSWATTNDATMFAQEITDDGEVYWGDDDHYNNADENTAAFIPTHGTCVEDDLDFTSDNGCWYGTGARHNALKITTPLNNPRTIHKGCWTYSIDWTWGNDSANFVHTTACHSASYVVTYFQGRYEALDPALHQYGGFHGAWSSTFSGLSDDFAVEAFSTSMADAWLNTYYVPNHWSSNDICPVSIVQGYDLIDAQRRRDLEQYDYQANDSNGAVAVYHFVAGCDGPGVDPWSGSNWYN